MLVVFIFIIVLIIAAQINNKGAQSNSKPKSYAPPTSSDPNEPPFEVYRNKEPPSSKPKIDVQYELERKIIEILMLYGDKTEEFEDVVLEVDEATGDLVSKPMKQEARVFEKIYLDLQEDEMHFSNPQFKTLYYSLIDKLNQDENFSTKNFINQLDQETASTVTSILMEDERYNLHDWERNLIIPKEKKEKDWGGCRPAGLSPIVYCQLRCLARI